MYSELSSKYEPLHIAAPSYWSRIFHMRHKSYLCTLLLALSFSTNLFALDWSCDLQLDLLQSGFDPETKTPALLVRIVDHGEDRPPSRIYRQLLPMNEFTADFLTGLNENSVVCLKSYEKLANRQTPLPVFDIKFN